MNITKRKINNLFVTEISMVSPTNFSSRFVRNLTQSIVAIKSTPYIYSNDKNANAKSILGLLSSNIKEGDSINIQTMNSSGYSYAESDLKFIVSTIRNESLQAR